MFLFEINLLGLEVSYNFFSRELYIRFEIKWIRSKYIRGMIVREIRDRNFILLVNDYNVYCNL